jgi:uncharacterized protein involved in exopolysaccharide biosynthesis
MGLLGAVVGATSQMHSGPSYTASAIVQPEFRGSVTHEKATDMQPLDPSLLLVGQVQLIRSQPLPAGIAEQLFGEGSNATSPPGLAVTAVQWLLGLALERQNRFPDVSKPVSTADIALEQLKSKLTVTYIPRSYLIQVSYTAPTPEGAAAVANALTSEFIRSERRKRLSEQVAAAASTLASLSATYGDKHPNIARAKADLEAVQTLLRGLTQAAAPMSENELADTGMVVPARANLASVNHGLRTILLGLVVGLLLGLSWAVFRQRKRLWDIVLA